MCGMAGVWREREMSLPEKLPLSSHRAGEMEKGGTTDSPQVLRAESGVLSYNSFIYILPSSDCSVPEMTFSEEQ